jgi:hypothetical protein
MMMHGVGMMGGGGRVDAHGSVADHHPAVRILVVISGGRREHSPERVHPDFRRDGLLSTCYFCFVFVERYSSDGLICTSIETTMR